MEPKRHPIETYIEELKGRIPVRESNLQGPEYYQGLLDGKGDAFAAAMHDLTALLPEATNTISWCGGLPNENGDYLFSIVTSNGTREILFGRFECFNNRSRICIGGTGHWIVEYPENKSPRYAKLKI